MGNVKKVNLKRRGNNFFLTATRNYSRPDEQPVRDGTVTSPAQ